MDLRLLTSRAFRGVCLVAIACAAACGDCTRRGDTGMCGACVRSATCKLGLTCVNEVCETAPPSCHVQIGL